MVFSMYCTTNSPRGNTLHSKNINSRRSRAVRRQPKHLDGLVSKKHTKAATASQFTALVESGAVGRGCAHFLFVQCVPASFSPYLLIRFQFYYVSLRSRFPMGIRSWMWNSKFHSIFHSGQNSGIRNSMEFHPME